MAVRLALGGVVIVRMPIGEVWTEPVLVFDRDMKILQIAASAGLVGKGRVCLVCLTTGRTTHRDREVAWAWVEEVA